MILDISYIVYELKALFRKLSHIFPQFLNPSQENTIPNV